MIAPSKATVEAFHLTGEPELLPGGEGRAYRIGDVILKHLNNDSAEQAIWSAQFFDQVKEDGFRISKPLKTNEGEWMTSDGWSAWKRIEGHHNYEQHLTEIIPALEKFHAAVFTTPRPDFIGDLTSAYYRSDAYAWGEKPETINPKVKREIELLYSLRKPLPELKEQLIHGDLGSANILIAEGVAPGIIDLAPYWRPAGFALAIFAYWIGPWLDKPDVLKKFEHIPHFKQLLVRAAIRNLLTEAEFGNYEDAEKYVRATQIVKEYA